MREVHFPVGEQGTERQGHAARIDHSPLNLPPIPGKVATQFGAREDIGDEEGDL
jgi:hypothetical protein